MKRFWVKVEWMMDLELLNVCLLGVKCSCVFVGLINKLETVDKAVKIVRSLTVNVEVFASFEIALVPLEQRLLKVLSGMLYGEECVFNALDNGGKKMLLSNP